MKLVTFDIDHTLITGARMHREGFKKVFTDIYGVKASTDLINTFGMTDRQVIIEVLKLKGLNEDQIFEKLPEAAKLLSTNYREVKDTSVKVLPGSRELLNSLRSKVILGLVTGNMRDVAYHKLKYVGLDNYFKLGGFSDDAIKRIDLFRFAILRAKKSYNFKFDHNFFHFGDTLTDVEIGKKEGFTSIGVATGIYSKKQLKEAGADYVLDNLKDTKKILKMLENSR